MKIPKKRTYLPLPMAWRNRTQSLNVANVVDEIQQEIEVYIGWKKYYKACFAFRLPPIYTIADAKLICEIIKRLCPDLESIKYRKLKDTFESIGIRGMVAGKTPKLKRVKIQREKKGGGKDV